MPPLYDLSPGDRAVVALPGSTDPDVAMFLDGLGVRPGVEVEVREKHPFDGPLVVSVDGSDRTLGEKVARQILVRVTPDSQGQRQEGIDNYHQPQSEKGTRLIMRFVAEGGYQPFHLHATEWGWLIFAAACGLIAIATGFYLMRGVLASDQGTPTMIEIAKAVQEGAQAYLIRQFKAIGIIVLPAGGPGVRHRQQGDRDPARRLQAHRAVLRAVGPVPGRWPSWSGPPSRAWPGTSA